MSLLLLSIANRLTTIAVAAGPACCETKDGLGGRNSLKEVDNKQEILNELTSRSVQYNAWTDG